MSDQSDGGLPRFAVAPWITHERLDDEVIAIDLETGVYYGLDDAAAECWTLLAEGATAAELVAALAGRSDGAPERVGADVDGFLADLVRERLVEERPAAEVLGRAVVGEPGAAPRPYVAPVLTKYDDLQNLLLLDPIHEVDNAGWPVARTE